MGETHHEEVDTRISKVVNTYKNIRGVEFINLPLGFGWAPDRHYHARIHYHGEVQDIVLKRCWDRVSYETERYVYERILPSVSFKTPAFYGGLELEGEYWIFIENIGTECAKAEKLYDREEVLQILGQLHGKSLSIINNLDNSQLHKFVDDNRENNEKANLLLRAYENEALRIDKWILKLHDTVWKTLITEPQTIIHGDTDFSNVIKNDKGFGLIDFERCEIGPVSIDFSKIVEYIESGKEYEAYQDAFVQASGMNISLEKVLWWAKLGAAYDAIHWICYDIKNFFNPSYEGYIFDKAAYHEKILRLEKLMDEYRNDL